MLFNLKGLLGDQDSVIPLTGSRRLVHGLAKELGLNTTAPYRVFSNGNRLGDGLKSMVTYYRLQPLGELLMKLH
ncbi:hypothetical protein GIB67_041906 [Kingdonia uniflora]|uniref:Uncharacterized protein n=1 Tax=Kingdonia uniflora TaxID=39325 RepID=A0A7J7PBB4_9MAGN|nr:hypothetical protein GIB67_041906 [Kingdonia uniflora]